MSPETARRNQQAGTAAPGEGLTASGISHAFETGVPVLDGVSLSVDEGSITCLFGPSGCGKTTLLRLIAGHETLQAGSITIGGQVMEGEAKRLPPEDRPIGYVFQDYALFPHLTVAQNVGFGLTGVPRPARTARVAALLEAVGLAALAGRYPHALSGGQQQRVAVARAFARRPRLLLLDEPLASVDNALRRNLQEQLRQLVKSEGVAALMVTHDPEEAIAVGDEIAIMRGGRLIEKAPPARLHAKPGTREGALLFPDTQEIDGVCRNGRFYTDVGETAVAMADGPGRIVVAPDGITIKEDPVGPLTCTDCRFSGKNTARPWQVFMEKPASASARYHAMTAEPVDPGVRLTAAINSNAVRFHEERTPNDNV